MKGIIVKGLVVTGVVIGLANYFIYLQTGRMPVKEWVQKINLSPDTLTSSAKNLGKDVIDQVKPSEPTKVYKWTDEYGVVHYGERPINDAAEEMEIDADHNILPASKPVESTEASPDADALNQQAPIEKARAAAEALKARAEAQENF